jgi:hypothetical protein
MGIRMEQRHFYRLPRNLIAKVGKSTGNFLAYVFDLSKNGMCITCNQVLVSGEKVTVSLNTPGHSDFLFNGSVAWQRTMPPMAKHKFQYGINLVREREYEIENFDKFLELQIRHDYEMRQHPRYPDVIAVENKDVIGLMDAAATNASLGGLYIRTREPLDVGHEYEIKLSNERLAKPIYSLVEVVSSFQNETDAFDHPYGAGIRFIAFMDDGKKRFIEYLKGLEEFYRSFAQETK